MRSDMILPAILFIALLGSLYTLFTQAPYAPSAVGRYENNETQRTIPRQLFNSLGQLARLVDISYCVGSSGIQKPFKCLSHCADFEDLELITTWNTGLFLSDSCGYIALSHPPSPKRIIVAFRGTYSIADTILDLSAYPQPYAPYDPKDEPHAHNERRSPRCLNCTVHAGFMTSWQNTRDTILHHVAAVREQHPDYALVLIGHSLGGAVAALAGIEMDLRGWDPLVTTFGEPKVGNIGLANYMSELFGLGGDDGAGATPRPSLHDEDPQDRRWRYHRVTHVSDPVPLLPLAEWKYEMHAGEIFISKTSLPPSVSDVEYCEGAHDPRCISGAGEDTLVTALQRAAMTLQDEESRPSEQAVPSYSRASRFVAGPPDDDERNEHEHEQRSPFQVPWDLTLPRYRLWGPFLAHRDYFWRLGVCVPGGDPTGGWK